MAAPESASIAVLAEKPSVARDIARVLGAAKSGDGYMHGNGYVVTWAIGHLAALAQPHEIKPEWRSWRRDLLPMLPGEWPLIVYEKTRKQFDVVRKILTSPRISGIVCATDAGREGELIFRYIYEAAGCSLPFRRLWISSLTPEAIRQGFDSLKPGAAYDSLADAARGRSRADWLVGMNLSRAYALSSGEKDISVGRVQTPTLAMLVERELAIRQFVPEDYLEVLATFHPTGGPKDSKYQGTWIRDRDTAKQDGQKPEEAKKDSLQQSMRLAPDGEEARQIAARARTGQAAIESMDAETQRMPPPALYDLTELQRHANRLYGFSAQKTLDTAQALYERHKLISYPRTDSRHLSQDVARTLPRIVAVIQAPYADRLAPGTGERPLGRRFVDDAKVSDHHAIIPTTVSPERVSLSPDESKIYDLICRRLLSAWHDDHIWLVTTIITAIRNGDVVDRYHTSGSAVEQVGWKVLDIAPAKARKGKDAKETKDAKGDAGKAAEPEQSLPAGLHRGQQQDVTAVQILEKKTRPPKRFTDATLLTAMETAGRTLDEKELSDAMKANGLGTPATRASIIEVLLKRNYVVRSGKMLEATDKGIRLIEVVHPEVKSPAMTGQWEAYLHRIQKGAAQLGPFLSGIEEYVTKACALCGSVPATERAQKNPPGRGAEEPWSRGSGSVPRAAPPSEARGRTSPSPTSPSPASAPDPRTPTFPSSAATSVLPRVPLADARGSDRSRDREGAVVTPRPGHDTGATPPPPPTVSGPRAPTVPSSAATSVLPRVPLADARGSDQSRDREGAVVSPRPGHDTGATPPPPPTVSGPRAPTVPSSAATSVLPRVPLADARGSDQSRDRERAVVTPWLGHDTGATPPPPPTVSGPRAPTVPSSATTSVLPRVPLADARGSDQSRDRERAVVSPRPGHDTGATPPPPPTVSGPRTPTIPSTAATSVLPRVPLADARGSDQSRDRERAVVSPRPGHDTGATPPPPPTVSGPRTRATRPPEAPERTSPSATPASPATVSGPRAQAVPSSPATSVLSRVPLADARGSDQSRDREGAIVTPRLGPDTSATTSAEAPQLTPSELLRDFGFASFRPGQEPVCSAVMAGRDVLVVMPTGAGKSLCYQLPGIARGGTTLVISPLIALMEDQSAKLRERGFAVERIHSGLGRAASREACIEYIHGRLQFLFIAPERLRIAGFPEMLAKHKPSLIAIDEAHCISQWGHDFRPDYRMLGQYLPSLRPCPVIALTATATPVVQDDIAAQLGLELPARFIQGFRRENLAIEVVEVPPSERSAKARELLTDPERRPAIVYAPTRALTEQLAALLGPHFPCAAYHAGLDAARRNRVQQEFFNGSVEVMVATIAFGMGIDKPDIRTVIHTALPGSLEQYYQEIGRAGRDGQPSRTILMHAWADRRTHDFFFDRDYPDVSFLDAVFAQLTAAPQDKAELQARLSNMSEEFDKALEKLWIHGGAMVDFAENVSRGHDRWRESYLAQSEQKKLQLQQMQRYTQSSQCRMSALVRHFGDLRDARKPCGKCDFCAPTDSIGQPFRPATEAELSVAATIFDELNEEGARATGRLHSDLCPRGELSRNEFEELLGALAREGLIYLTEAVFEKDGKSVPYRKASLTSAGYAVKDAYSLELLMKDEGGVPARTPASRGKRKPKRPRTQLPAAAPNSAVADALRKWRMEEARRRGVPPFRIFTDRALAVMAIRRPSSVEELLEIPGVSRGLVEKHGAQLYRILTAGR